MGVGINIPLKENVEPFKEGFVKSGFNSLSAVGECAKSL
jgi:hypothetical protein